MPESHQLQKNALQHLSPFLKGHGLQGFTINCYQTTWTRTVFTQRLTSFTHALFGWQEYHCALANCTLRQDRSEMHSRTVERTDDASPKAKEAIGDTRSDGSPIQTATAKPPSPQTRHRAR
jgi:hypothetical protein